MRKSIYMILVAALAAVSCENTVDKIWSDDNEAMLVLNAQLRQDERIHRVFVDCSQGAGSDEVQDAAVVCSINGAAAIAAVADIREEVNFRGDTYEKFYGYAFEADLLPGDKIEITAYWKDLSAKAVAEVPASAARIAAIDTMRVVLAEDNPWGETGRTTRQYNIAIRDKAGEKNYYMLASRDVYYKLDASGAKIDSIAVKSQFDTDYDPILNPIENSLLDEIIGSGNNYDIFTDEMFADASYTLKLYDSYYSAYSDDFVHFWDGFETGGRYCMDRLVMIYTLSFDEFLYLKAINAAGNDLGFMTEPVIYPENVIGGLGFVTVVTPEIRRIQFPVQTYTGEPPFDAYRYVDPMPTPPEGIVY